MWSPFFKPQQTRTEIRQPRIPCCRCLPISCIFSPKKIIQGILSGLNYLWNLFPCVMIHVCLMSYEWWTTTSFSSSPVGHSLFWILLFSSMICPDIPRDPHFCPLFSGPLYHFIEALFFVAAKKRNMCKGQCASNRHFSSYGINQLLPSVFIFLSRWIRL